MSEYKTSKNRCPYCGNFLIVWPDTMEEDMPPEGVNRDTNEFCENCYGDQN
jgi:uncharacterized protein with PIN domain